MKKFICIILLISMYSLVKAQYPIFSSAKNSFGLTQSSNTCLTYNKDLNALAFTQRLTAYWPDSAFVSTPNPLATNGYLVTKWSTDEGVTWDSTCYYQNDSNWGRYPGGVIYNPQGNTQINNAFVVGYGPTFNGTGWDGMYFASAKMDGSISANPGMHTQTSNDQQWFAIDSLSNGDSIYMMVVSSALTDSAIWLCSRIINSNFEPRGFALIKGSYNGNGFTWVADTVFKNAWVVGSHGYEYLDLDPQIAFQPNNPLIGYILVNGVDSLSTHIYGKKTYYPMVWKTIDGGQNWNRINMNYNWVSGDFYDGYFFANLTPTLPDYRLYPKFINAFGGEITVDNNGYLNYVTAIESTYSSHRDSLHYMSPNHGFLYSSGQFGDNCTHPLVVNLRTNGDGTWEKRMLSLLDSDNMDSNDNYWPWTRDGLSPMSYHNRIQISRNTSGNKIFFSWMDTQTADLNVATSNTRPSLHFMGYDVVSEKYSNKKTIPYTTTGKNGFWWMLASDVIIDDSVNFTIPVVYADQNGMGSYNGSTQTDLHYVNDATIHASEFVLDNPGDNLFMQCFFINSLESDLDTKGFDIFPNPASQNLSIQYSGNATELRISDMLGKEIKNVSIVEGKTEIDLSELTNGIYFISVVDKNQIIVTKKLVVQH